MRIFLRSVHTYVYNLLIIILIRSLINNELHACTKPHKEQRNKNRSLDRYVAVKSLFLIPLARDNERCGKLSYVIIECSRTNGHAWVHLILARFREGINLLYVQNPNCSWLAYIYIILYIIIYLFIIMQGSKAKRNAFVCAQSFTYIHTVSTYQYTQCSAREPQLS